MTLRPIVILFLSVATLILTGCSSATESVESEQQNPMPVTGVPVQWKTQVEVTQFFPARMEAAKTTAMASELAGRLMKVEVEEGDLVNEGDLLFSVDTQLLEQQQLASEARLASLNADLELTEKRLQRQRNLKRSDFSSNDELDALEAQLKKIQAQQNLTRAELKSLNIQIEKSNVVAPFSGAVSQRLLDEGAYLAPGSHVLTLTSARVNELVVALPATIARQLSHQKDYQFTFSKKPITARWHSTYPAVDALTQTRKVKFVIDGNETIVAGEYLELQWPLTIEKEGFWLPNSALIKGRKGLWEVFIVDSQKRAVKHNVDVLYTERDRSYVSANFSEDALVVDSGTHRLTNHTPVVFQNLEAISSTTNSSTTVSSKTNSSTRITQHLPIGATDNDA